ncbi:hypothetical protein GH733_015501, partial [Mirounga leonina]
MACGATLKRPMEFEAALLSPGSPKRRRCAPLPGPTPGLRPPDAEPPPLLQTQTPPPTLQQPAPPGSERRLPTPEIREGWGGPSVRFRFSWSWRDWRGGQQEEDETIPGRSGPFPCAKPLLPPLPGPAQSRPADPVGHGKWDSTHEPGLEEQIFQNIKQEYSRYQRWRHLEVVLNQSEACTSENYEDKIREEYEQILNTKLAEQYESFVKFTHDQIMRRYGTRPTSCKYCQGSHLFLEEELAVAVMGVALQWDSHTKTKEGQLRGPSEVLKDGSGMGNAAALMSCYRISG